MGKVTVLNKCTRVATIMANNKELTVSSFILRMDALSSNVI
jgi:hypothetical protein